MITPISPKDVGKQQQSQIPEWVIDTINRLIAANMNGPTSRILQKDIVEALMKRDSSVSRNDISERGWLNFEPMYREAGWEVYYDKPGYNESYEANFTFS